MLGFIDNPIVSGPPHSRFYAGLPLKAENKKIMGTLCIFDFQPHQFPTEDEALLKDLSALVKKEMNFPDLQTLTLKLQNSENSLL
ncbi:MAG: GAF domain-containing protein [Urechidicola sp.]|jgi:GAF domain-containing protein